MLAVETGNQLVVRELLINKAKEQLKIVKPVSRLTLTVNLVSSLKTVSKVVVSSGTVIFRILVTRRFITALEKKMLKWHEYCLTLDLQ